MKQINFKNIKLSEILSNNGVFKLYEGNFISPNKPIFILEIKTIIFESELIEGFCSKIETYSKKFKLHFPETYALFLPREGFAVDFDRNKLYLIYSREDSVFLEHKTACRQVYTDTLIKYKMLRVLAQVAVKTNAIGLKFGMFYPDMVFVRNGKDFVVLDFIFGIALESFSRAFDPSIYWYFGIFEELTFEYDKPETVDASFFYSDSLSFLVLFSYLFSINLKHSDVDFDVVLSEFYLDYLRIGKNLSLENSTKRIIQDEIRDFIVKSATDFNYKERSRLKKFFRVMERNEQNILESVSCDFCPNELELKEFYISANRFAHPKCGEKHISKQSIRVDSTVKKETRRDFVIDSLIDIRMKENSLQSEDYKEVDDIKLMNDFDTVGDIIKEVERVICLDDEKIENYYSYQKSLIEKDKEDKFAKCAFEFYNFSETICNVIANSTVNKNFGQRRSTGSMRKKNLVLHKKAKKKQVEEIGTEQVKFVRRKDSKPPVLKDTVKVRNSPIYISKFSILKKQIMSLKNFVDMIQDITEKNNSEQDIYAVMEKLTDISKNYLSILTEKKNKLELISTNTLDKSLNAIMSLLSKDRSNEDLILIHREIESERDYFAYRRGNMLGIYKEGKEQEYVVHTKDNKINVKEGCTITMLGKSILLCGGVSPEGVSAEDMDICYSVSLENNGKRDKNDSPILMAKELKNMSFGRAFHAALRVNTFDVHLIGGKDGIECEKYEINNERWTKQIPSLPYALVKFRAMVFDDIDIYLFFGTKIVNGEHINNHSVLKYSLYGNLERWIEFKVRQNIKLSSFSLLRSDNTIYIVGGLANNDWKFDRVTEKVEEDKEGIYSSQRKTMFEQNFSFVGGRHVCFDTRTGRLLTI